MTKGELWSAVDMELEIAEYGQTLIAPPTSAWTLIDAIQGTGTKSAVFHVTFPLWTAQEGRSDLEIELQLTEVDQGVFETKLLNIYVP